jgi:hypothetical protein
VGQDPFFGHKVENIGIVHGPWDRIEGPAPQSPIEEPPVQPVPVQPVPVEPVADQRTFELQRELENARSLLAAERQARQEEEQRYKDGLAQLEEFNRQQKEKEIEALLSGEGAEYVSLDPDDAKKLIQPLYNKLKAEQDQARRDLEAKLTEQSKLIEGQIKGSQEALEKENRTKFYAALESAIPNFKDFVKSPAYATYLKTPFQAGFRQTTEEVLNKELQAGNFDAVVNHLKNFALGRHNPADIAQVGGAAVSPQFSVTTNVDADKARRDRLNMIRTGKISRAAYRKLAQQDVSTVTRAST